MSGDRYTLDTNVLIYAVDRNAGSKHELAVEIVRRSYVRPCVLTVQSLAEFVSAVTRKGMVPVVEAVAHARDWLALFPVVAADARALDLAYRAAETRRLGLFDALLLATARQAGCTTILSENMHDGGTFEGITVRNPLVEGGLPPDLRTLLGMSREG